jgi:sulfoacetaldehyde acetyltransferase
MIASCGFGFPALLGAPIGCPERPLVGFAGDGAFGIAMNEMTACGRNEWPAVTMVIFRNYQWGAEKRNNTLWYANNFVGTELNVGVEYAEVAEACGLKGVKVDSMTALEAALKTAIDEQMTKGVTTFIEVVLNLELGEPFRRDAMTVPNVVAGIDPNDMIPQK